MNNWKSTFKYCSGQWRTMESKTLRTTDIGDNQGKKLQRTTTWSPDRYKCTVCAVCYKSVLPVTKYCHVKHLICHSRH